MGSATKRIIAKIMRDTAKLPIGISQAVKLHFRGSSIPLSTHRKEVFSKRGNKSALFSKNSQQRATAFQVLLTYVIKY